jgi:hypothetical protein
MKIGAFQVEPGCCPMSAGDFLKVTLPDGRVVVLYADATDPELQGGTSVLEVWPDQSAIDAADPGRAGYKMIGF